MIAALVFALSLPYVTHAATPQGAALGVLYPHSGVTVLRVNVVGKYATVLTRGATMEGAPVKGSLLLEHFSFGWQALALLDYCRFDKGFSARDRSMLLQGMPAPRGADDCVSLGDSGPQRDIESVRLLMHGLIPYVVVRGDYAVGEWYGSGGGQHFYRKGNGTWGRIGGSGGSMSASEVMALGVPAKDLCAFHVYDAHCSP